MSVFEVFNIEAVPNMIAATRWLFKIDALFMKLLQIHFVKNLHKIKTAKLKAKLIELAVTVNQRT